MNRLWGQIALPFLFLVVLGMAIVGIFVQQQVGSEFRRFVTRTELAESGLADTLARYYESRGGWQGVEQALRGQVPRRGALRPILLDVSGRVLFSAEPTAPRLPPRRLNDATPIEVDSEVVGYLLLDTPRPAELAGPALTFLTRINRLLLRVGVIAVAVGLVTSVLIARGVTAPLSRLGDAARRISRGELGERVPVEGPDEVAELAVAFNEMATSLEKAEELRQNMIADVAHELRTPLSVLQGNLQALLDGVYPLEKREVAAIYDETLILSRLVADLHELAQADADRLPFTLAPTDVPPLIERVIALFEEPASAQDVTLSMHLPADLPPVRADADRVQQVLHNLLANALRHTPAGGRIEVSADRPTSTLVRIAVTDTGRGIPATDVPHVFDRFWRAEKSRARERGGSGLGLAIAKQVVVAMGGEIGVESEIGQGSTFWFTMPISS